MVVRQDDSGGVVVNDATDELARVHRGVVNGAVKELFESQNVVFCIQKDSTEDLSKAIAEFGYQKVRSISRCGDGVTLRQPVSVDRRDISITACS